MEKAAFNLQRQADVIGDSLTSASDRQQAIQNNPNASPSDKAAATVLAGTEMAMSMAGNLIKTIAPDGGINRWWYDKLGQCLKHENAKGGVTEYEYDLLGQVTNVKEPDGNIRYLTLVQRSLIA